MSAENGHVLTDPINLNDLLNGGTHFQINSQFNHNTGDEFFIDDDYGNDEDDDDGEAYRKLLTPWDRSFEELRSKMTLVTDGCYKRITKQGVGDVISSNARVTIDYNAFWEHEKCPFDSTSMRGEFKSFVLGRKEVLSGLNDAVCSMKVSEEAQFVISYQLLFGELGCPPRIKPKADALFIVKLVSYNDAGDADALDKLAEEDKRSFAKVKEKVADIKHHAKDCFSRNLITNAINAYHKAVASLEYCTLENATEEREQKDLLVSLYTSLAVCYNRRGHPSQACSMVNEIRHLCDINNRPKVLFHEGKALRKLGEYQRARASLVKAQKLCPNDEAIQKELISLNEDKEKYQHAEKAIWTRALGLSEQHKASNANDDNEEFVQCFQQSMKDFMADPKSSVLTLPDGLSEKEVNSIEKLAEEFQVKLVVQMEKNKKFYQFHK